MFYNIISFRFICEQKYLNKIITITNQDKKKMFVIISKLTIRSQMSQYNI